MIAVKKGDLFKKAPEGAYLLHACNAQGVWGSGIAKDFKKHYVESFKEYEAFCDEQLASSDSVGASGKCFITSEKVICLVTSFDYGKAKDSVDTIIANTTTAVHSMLQFLTGRGLTEVEIHSPKINSGLFDVPWEDTEATIKSVLSQYSITVNWTVWEL